MKAHFHGIVFFLSACLAPMSAMAQGPDRILGIPGDFGQTNRLVAGKVKTVEGDPRRGAKVMAAPLLAGVAGIVAIDAGQVEGTVSADSKVRMFKGIPFAAPPIGALRWKAPNRFRAGPESARRPSLGRAACKPAFTVT